MGSSKRTGIGTLPMVAPGCRNQYAVFQDIYPSFGGIWPIATSSINANAYPHAFFLLRGGFFSRFFFGGFVFRANDIDHFFESKGFRNLSGGGGCTWAVNIDIAQFQWIHAHFFSQFVH